MSELTPRDVKRLVDLLQVRDITATKTTVERIRAHGDDTNIALEIVAAAFGPSVRSFIHRRLHGNPQDEVEIWTDTLFRVFNRIDGFDAKRSAFRTWVFNQAHYSILDHSRSRETNREDPSSAPADQPTIDDQLSPLSKTERTALARATRRLSHTERQILWARHVEGLTSIEIAERRLDEDIPSSHVRVYASRAADRLRRYYLAELQELGVVTIEDRV